MTWERIDELPDLFFLLRLGRDVPGFGLVSGARPGQTGTEPTV